ncbi:post-transcriptional regulator [Camelliibacillus cellulosilyticus]|uniref:Post-transcriptional regulator n=1 Tax=Camelliibacillus cellulosilyticus TaxID=2174486 RepID=A0ABV9GLS4_9BACL
MDKTSGKYSEWREKIKPFLISKLEEFHFLGLERLTMDELWAFIEETLEKQKVEPRLYRIVGSVMRLSVNDYMNKIRMEMFKGVDILKENQPLP